MEKYIITLLLSLLFIPSFIPGFSPGFSQNYKYEYRGRFSPSIKKEKLNEAGFINQIMPEFCRYVLLPNNEGVLLNQLSKTVGPPNYAQPLGNYLHVQENYEKIIDYVSIEISAIRNGKVLTSKSTSDELTTEQKSVLNAADIGTDIHIKIKFRYKYWIDKSLTGGNEIREGEYAVTIVPETEAEYPGGFKQLTAYLTENVFNKISVRSTSVKIRQAIVKFTVNEEGQVVDTKIFRTSADPQTDKLILDAINKMPKWKPAKNSNGIKVKQEFSIPFGESGGC